MKEKILISACINGEKCRYNGSHCYNELVSKLSDKYELISVCPEMMGGLPCPRVPSEIVGDKVITKDNKDVTKEFTLGAEFTVNIAKLNDVKKAVLKDKSPSCGKYKIYDGTFNSNLINGQGITCRALSFLDIYTEDEIEELL